LNQPYGLTAKVLLSRQDFPINPLDPRNRTSTYDYQAWTMGLLHDANVVGLNAPLPGDVTLAPVTAAVPFAGALVGAPSTRYVLENGTNNNLAVALPKLWADADFAVSQVDAAFTAGGRTFPAGTFNFFWNALIEGARWPCSCQPRCGVPEKRLAGMPRTGGRKVPARAGWFETCRSE
jgi:hypothetical protein